MPKSRRRKLPLISAARRQARLNLFLTNRDEVIEINLRALREDPSRLPFTRRPPAPVTPPAEVLDGAEGHN